MDIQFWVSLTGFLFVTSGTPGPNNMLLTTSGANFGYWRTVPQLAGITIGLGSMLLWLCLGLDQIFKLYPELQDGLKVAGSAYLIWLAYQITTTTGLKAANGKSRPMGFWRSFCFQYLNPKAWLMVISAIGSFTLPDEQFWPSSLAIMAGLAVINFPTCSLWVKLGQHIANRLESPLAWKRFNQTMGLLTLSCILMLWV
jgi:threonine/homoserine/homoserine lactone efflux protein